MNKMKALKDFDEGESKVKSGDVFRVNDEQQFRLTREGKAERCADQSDDESPVPDAPFRAMTAQVSVDP